MSRSSSELKPLIGPDFDGDVAHYWRDDGQGGGEIVSQQDVGPALEANKRVQNELPRYLHGKDMWPEAHIPDVIILKWLNEEGLNVFDKNAWPQVVRKLNDPDWRYLRLRPGKT